MRAIKGALLAVMVGCSAAVPPGTDGGSGAACTLGGTGYATGATDPSNPCLACNPQVSASAWAAVADLTGCASAGGNYCQAGSCVAACAISGLLVPAGTGNPLDGCQLCDPARDPNAWSPVSGCDDGGVAASDGGPDAGAVDADGGTDAGSGTQSDAGSDAGLAAGSDGGADAGLDAGPDAGPTCLVGGSSIPSGQSQPGDDCRACQPLLSATSYTPLGDGTPCGTSGGNVCLAGSCILACDIGGVVVDAGLLDPSGCQSCQPQTSTAAYTPLLDGTACSTSGGDVCVAGACVPGCYIGGALAAAHAFQSAAADSCCNPALSLTQWTPGFAALPATSAQGTVIALTSGDVNGDGRSDLVYGTSTGQVILLLGLPDGGFAASALVTSGAAVTAVAVGDVTGDGRADVSYLAGNLPTLLVQGSALSFSAGGSWPAIPDAGGLWAVETKAGTKLLSFSETWYVHIGMPNYAVPADLISMGDPAGALVADPAITLEYFPYAKASTGAPIGLASGSLLGPGSMDIVVSVDGGAAQVFDYDGGWNLIPNTSAPFPAFGTPYLALGELNGDGYADFASSHGTDLGLYVNEPFGPGYELMNSVGAAQLPSGARFTGLAFAPFRGAGGDVLAAADSANGALELYGAFAPFDAGVVALGAYATLSAQRLVVGDFNGDGRPDVAVTAGGQMQVLQRQCP